MLICVDFDASGTKRQQAFWVFAEIEDKFLRMESTMLGFVDLFRHLYRKLILIQIF